MAPRAELSPWSLADGVDGPPAGAEDRVGLADEPVPA